MKRYSVETVTEAAVRYFYIQDCETMEMEILPSRYLVHKVKSNRSPNTVKRAAFALCYYLEYLSEKGCSTDQSWGTVTLRQPLSSKPLYQAPAAALRRYPSCPGLPVWKSLECSFSISSSR